MKEAEEHVKSLEKYELLNSVYRQTQKGENINSSHQMKEAEEWIIIVDLDGTIIDSEATNFSVLNQVLKEFGYDKHRTTIMRGIAEGKTAEEIMEMIDMNMETRKKMGKRIVSLLDRIPVPVLPGVIENLKALKDMGLLFCVATDNNIRTVARVISEHGLNEVFESKLILTMDTFPLHKPSSDVIKELMKRSGRKKAIVVGNTPKEVALARNSGCPVVIITDGKGLGSKTAKRKDTFKYEWETYGGFSGEDIYPVPDWKEVKTVIIEITQKSVVR